MVVRANQTKSIEMRGVYTDTLIDMSKEDSRVVALDCDLTSTIGMGKYAKEFPDRMVNCGIQEADMAGIAAGMSADGCIPFAHTFACFQSRKCVDQIFLSAGFAQLNAKYVGSDPGILALYNGGSHMALEDMGILANVPGMTLVEPADTVTLEAVLRAMKDQYGNFYLRMNRKNANTIYDPETKFEIGKGLTVCDGTDATIIAAGMMVEQAIIAHDLLAEEGISVRVIDMFTWKPLDEELVVKAAKETGAIVTAENHRITTGLGSAVANVLVEQCPVPMTRVGVEDVYGEVGVLPYLMETYKLRGEDIAKKVKETIARK